MADNGPEYISTRIASIRARGQYDAQLGRVSNDPIPADVPYCIGRDAPDILKRAAAAEAPASNPLDSDGWPVMDWSNA